MATQDANHLHAFGVDVADPGRGTPEDQLSIEHNSRRMPARFRYSSKPRARVREILLTSVCRTRVLHHHARERTASW